MSKACVKNKVKPLNEHIPPKKDFCTVPNLKTFAKDFTVK
jgi:hypothetical protein